MSASSNPGWNRGSLGVSAASDDRWPPAEPPVMATKSGSPPYSAMWVLTHARARLTSTMWSGHVLRGLCR